MSYTIEELDNVVETAEFAYEESGWDAFNELLNEKTVYVTDPDYPLGEDQEFRDGKVIEKRRVGGDEYYWATVFLPKPRVGADLPGIGWATILEDFGGEGQGDQYWFVFQVEAEDGSTRIFRRNGWYASYSGGDYDGPTVEVKPVEKVVTVWEEL